MFKIKTARQLLTGLLMASSLLTQFCGGGRKYAGVYITDISASVERESIEECFTAFEECHRTLRRGTRLAFIPVTSDAAIDTPGRIKRFEIGERREAYDEDLKREMRKIKADLGAMREAAVGGQYQQTDLIGAVAQAAEEFAQTEEKTERWLVVLSDFLQDDRSFDFVHDDRLGNHDDAVKLAREIAAARRFDLRGARVYLGMVRSRDLQALPAERRMAVRAFWREFLKISGASSVEEATDGPGLLAKFVRKGIEQQ